MKEILRIGAGAGFAGDRLEPAVELALHAKLDFLVLECLAERTIALAQKQRLRDPEKGYDVLLTKRLQPLLPVLAQNNVKLISNMGAANPVAAAKEIAALATSLGLSIKIAALTGDQVFPGEENKTFSFDNFEPFPDDQLLTHGDKKIDGASVISANAYIGVEGILEALQNDAQIIVTGRVADPSLFLAPMIHSFGWSLDDIDLLGKGTVIGHLLECAGQVTGGYFGDPLRKPVRNLEQLGHPFAEISADGSATITKLPGTGGCVNLQTVKEQLLYEVVNPHAYLTPDVAADFTTVKLQQTDEDRVFVSGGSGKSRPERLKVSVGYKAFYLGEGEISYAGPAALERAEWAGAILKERLGDRFPDLRIDLLGLNAIGKSVLQGAIPSEIRVRAAGKAASAELASTIGEEVEALYTNGPAAGGAVRKYVTEVVGIVSVLLDRSKILPRIHYFQT